MPEAVLARFATGVRTEAVILLRTELRGAGRRRPEGLASEADSGACTPTSALQTGVGTACTSRSIIATELGEAKASPHPRAFAAAAPLDGAESELRSTARSRSSTSMSITRRSRSSFSLRVSGNSQLMPPGSARPRGELAPRPPVIRAARETSSDSCDSRAEGPARRGEVRGVRAGESGENRRLATES